MKMKIVSIEGLDKAGKNLASKFLANQLALKGLRVVKSEFHRYDTPTGKMIQDYLTKKWDCSDETIELIMAADKQNQQDWFKELEAQGVDVLILDRYTLSQYVYSVSKGVSPYWANALQRYMRQPDYTVLLDISAATSMSRKGKHNNGVNDRYEENLKLLEGVRNNYLENLEAYVRAGSACIINGEMPLEHVHREILNAVEQDVLQVEY